MDNEIKIIFLHHSTGKAIWNGDTRNLGFFIGKIQQKISGKSNPRSKLSILFSAYNKKNAKRYSIYQMTFPKEEIYGWNNYPFDYYNIWVKHAGENPYKNEPTLEILTKSYQVIMFKHCFPVSKIQQDKDSADIDSDRKSLANYKLQYLALREKLLQFKNTKFVLWTGAALVKKNSSEDEAVRTREFFNWVKNEWDRPDDNIYLWDFYELETEGNLYMKEEFAVSTADSHPNKIFSDHAAELLFNRIIDIIETNGSSTSLTGLKK